MHKQFLSLSRREFVKAAGSAALLAGGITPAFPRLLDSQGNVPRDIQTFLNENTETRLMLRSYLQLYKFKDDPAKMKAAIKALNIGLGQYARYQADLKKLERDGITLTPAEQEEKRKRWSDQTQKLMCGNEALTSPLLVEMCFALADPDARAESVERALKKSEKALEVGEFGANVAATVSRRFWPLAVFISGLSVVHPDPDDTAGDIRHGVSEGYLQRMFQVAEYAAEYLSSEAIKNPGGDAALLGTILQDTEVQEQTGHKPGAELTAEDVKTLPEEYQALLAGMQSAYASAARNPEEQAKKVAGELFQLLQENSKKAGAELARIKVEQQKVEEEKITAAREVERSISNLRGCGQLAGIFLQEVLGKPELAGVVNLASRDGIDLYMQLEKFTEEMKSGLGTSIAATALTGNIISFGLSLFSMLDSQGPSADEIILEQIQNLQKELGELKDIVIQGFSRLERINIEILSRIEEVLHDVNVGFGTVQAQLADIRKEISESRNDDFQRDRDTARDSLQKAADSFLQQIGQGDDAYSMSNEMKGHIRDLKGEATTYALNQARTLAQSSARPGGTNLSDALNSVALRQDLETLTGILGVVAKYLDSSIPAEVLPNPITWNDGVSVYANMLLSTLSYATSADNDTLRALHKDGKAAADFVRRHITQETIAKAATKYLKAVDRLVAKIADIFLERIRDETNDASAYPYTFGPSPYFQIQDGVLDAAQAIGLLELRFGQNPYFPERRPVQLIFKKGPSRWNGLTIGDTIFDGTMTGKVLYDDYKRHDIGLEHGVALIIMMPPPVSETELPYYPDGTLPVAKQLAGSLPVVVYSKDIPPMMVSRYGFVGHPVEVLPTIYLYQLISTAIHEYTNDLHRRIAADIFEAAQTRKESTISAELGEVDNTARAFELLIAAYRYRQGVEARGADWPQAPKGSDYLSLMVNFLAADIGEQQVLMTNYVDIHDIKPYHHSAPGFDPASKSLLLLKVDDFDMRAITLRHKIAHKAILDSNRIDNMLIAAFRAVAEDATSGLTDFPDLSDETSFADYDRGLATLRFAASARGLHLQ